MYAGVIDCPGIICDPNIIDSAKTVECKGSKLIYYSIRASVRRGFFPIVHRYDHRVGGPIPFCVKNVQYHNKSTCIIKFVGWRYPIYNMYAGVIDCPGIICDPNIIDSAKTVECKGSKLIYYSIRAGIGFGFFLIVHRYDHRVGIPVPRLIGNIKYDLECPGIVKCVIR